MQDKDVEAVVIGYLKKRGFKQTETVLRTEAKLANVDETAFLAELEDNVNVANYILFYNPNEATPERYQESYAAFREWIMNSALDMYRQELSTLLYPMFIHCYLDLVAKNFSTDGKICPGRYSQLPAKSFLERNKKDHNDLHNDEILSLSTVTIPEHIQTNDTSSTWRNNRYNVTLCRFSFELVVGFLQEKKYMLLLSIMNQYMNIRVFSGQPNPAPLEDYHAITGKTDKELNTLNKKEVYWGLYEENLPKTKEVTPVEDKPEKEEEKPEDPKNKTEPPNKKVKKEVTPVKLPRSILPLPRLSEQAEAEHLEDISKRVSLSASSLPSICFYTLFHSHQSCNTIEIARDASVVAGGFSDSTVRIWELKKSKSTGHGKLRKDDYTSLVGHSGPVYGASFSPDRNYLLTCSEDKTVCYKGHNYPIWDVEFSPHGYFFVTASHDRTARLWATDQIFPLRIFAGHLSDVNCVKFHPNCNYVATGSTDKSLRLWDVNSGQPIRIFTGHYGSITSMAMSPDGKMLASAGDDNKIILWDLATSKKMATFTGHKRTIWSLDFSAESTILASGSADETVKLWDVSGGVQPQAMEEGEQQPTNGKTETSMELLRSFPTKQTPVFKVAFTRRNLLLSAGPFAAED